MTSKNTEPEILWHPSQRQGKIAMDEYRQHVNQKFEKSILDTHALHRWSIEEPHDFWIDIYNYLDITPPLPTNIKKAYNDKLPLSSIPCFFANHEINYAENVMFSNTNPDAPALIGIREGSDIHEDPVELFTWGDFRERVRETASALKHSGIQKGDRVAALVATSPWAVILFHAAASIGAIFTSISPELGAEGCIARLKQITPSIIFFDSHSIYKGKKVSTLQKVRRIVTELESRPQVYMVPIIRDYYDRELPRMEIFLKNSKSADELSFARVPFNYPLLICYSSGTTGVPKCIVHHHGMVLQSKKVSVLHNCLTEKDTVMQYTSTSWVAFYGMCGHLTAGSTLVVYNGSPLFPDATQMLRICGRFRLSFMGVSPRLLLEIEASGAVPKDDFDLSNLKTVHTTGAPLSHEQYRWFYKAFPESTQICNIAGGTETGTHVIAMDPSGLLHAGEMQVLGLGIDVDIVDPETGHSIANTGHSGEMIIRKPFPSMPCFFWGDTGGKIYKAAYFERFTNIDVWAQHDWLRKNPKTGGYIMHGRSDAVLSKSYLS